MSFKAKLVFTGLPVASPVIKWDWFFLLGTNRTLACSALAQDISVRMRRMRRIDQRTSAEYIRFNTIKQSIFGGSIRKQTYECKRC